MEALKYITLFNSFKAIYFMDKQEKMAAVYGSDYILIHFLRLYKKL